ncbi:hypothetical protein TNIN_380761, partial [Trichonephila inaurata madagascariensis]
MNWSNSADTLHLALRAAGLGCCSWPPLFSCSYSNMYCSDGANEDD